MKEITEILCLNKEDVIKKWKSLRNTFVRQKHQIQMWGWLKLIQTKVIKECPWD